MNKCLTLITGLPGAGKSTLGDGLENLEGSKIAHCDYDKIFDAILDTPIALQEIGKGYFPEKDQLPFLLGTREAVLQLVASNTLYDGLFQGAIFEFSMGTLERFQETKKRTFGILSVDGSNALSRSIMIEQARIFGYTYVDLIEVGATKEELIQTACAREDGINTDNIFLLPSKKKSPQEVKAAIQQHEPYEHSKEKLFRRHLCVDRESYLLQQVYDWIVGK